VNIIAEESNSEYNEEDFDELIRAFESGIEKHEGYGVSFDLSIPVIRSTTPSKRQIRIIKLFRGAECSRIYFNAWQLHSR
jgi:hypothetical protein